MADTSSHGGMYKDQIYLRGAISVLKYRKSADMVLMHCGKLTIKDCIRLRDRGIFNTDKCKFPYFLKDYNQYMSALNCISK